jgi:hypothetical protein
MADIPTSCGTLTPQTFELITFGGEPDIQQGHIPYFHRMLCQWAYAVAQQFSFVVVIEAVNKDYLLNKFRSTMKTIEPPGWDVESMVSDTWKRDTQEVVGCIFANAVRIPGENTTTERVGVSEGSRRGFINAPIISGRADFSPLDIGFNETNQSFIDGILRPWTIIAAHEGLMARPSNQSIKANIQIYQLARAMDDKSEKKNIIRKHWTFEGCVPINVVEEDLGYNATDYGKRQVQFVYNSYNLVGVQSGGSPPAPQFSIPNQQPTLSDKMTPLRIFNQPSSSISREANLGNQADA